MPSRKTAIACAGQGLLLLVLLPGVARSQVSLGLNRLLIVSGAGTPAQNCQGLRDALAAITATAASPHVLRLEPGEYDCGSTPLTMKSFVDVEGSGEGVTRIFGDHDATADDLGVIDLVDQMEIRSLTVENTGGHMGLATAVSATTAGESRIRNATILSDDDTGTGCGMFVALPGGGAASSVVVHIRDSTIRGDFDGIFLQNGTGKLLVRGSSIEGANDVGVVLVMGDVVVLAHSELINGYDDNGEAVDLTCLYSYDGNQALLDATCDPMP